MDHYHHSQLKGAMLRSVTQADKLEKRWVAIFQVYSITVEIRHNPFSPKLYQRRTFVHAQLSNIWDDTDMY